MNHCQWKVFVAVVGFLVCGQLVVSQTATSESLIVERRPLSPPSTEQDPTGALKHVRLEEIKYLSDGLHIKGYLAIPDGQGPYPVVIWNRGGNPLLSLWTAQSAWDVLGKVASWGYVVIASQYRGADGSEGHDEYGGADVDDVLNLIEVLNAVPSADRTRIGMCGRSRGGMMTYLALTRTDKIRAAVIISGLSDLLEAGKSRPGMLDMWKKQIPDFNDHMEETLKQRSVIQWPEKLPTNVPLLIIHGTADWRVSPLQAFDLVRALYAAQRPLRFVLYEGGSHGVPEFDEERNTLIRSWLDAYVRDLKKWPDLKPHGE
jgi:dipeptidyl aminopeptidase/acylaminoacyl peptidase